MKKKKIYLAKVNYEAVKKQYSYTEKQMKEQGYCLEKEEHIQTAFVNYVRSKYGRKILVFSIPNGTKSRYTNNLNSKLGMTKGMPDICILSDCRKSTPLFLEFKRDNKHKATEKQLEVHQQLKTLGYPCFIVSNVDEAVEIVERWLKN